MVTPHPTVLLTGFDAFGGETVNPSWLAVQRLHGRQVAGHRVVARQLPTVFGASVQALQGHIDRWQPRLVLATGLAANRRAMSLERVAINVDDARMPDNAGAQPIDRPVVPGGPAAYFTTLPIKAMLLALQDAGYPAEVSQTAGTFVCNHLFYGLLHGLREAVGVRAGFVHVPPLAVMDLETLVAGLALAVRVALTAPMAGTAVAAGAIS